MPKNSLFDRSRAGEPFLIKDYADDDLVVSVPAEIFKADLGIVFVDPGWCGSMVTSHPFHVLEGKLQADGPWQLGRALIYPLSNKMPEYAIWAHWMSFKKEHPYCTRENALKHVREVFHDVEIFD